MKMKKAVLFATSFVLLLACVMCMLPMGKMAQAKTIVIEKGETYKLKIKKGSKISVSDNEIVKVNKKGKITALKKGKCTVKVKKGKKVKKYKIRVDRRIWGVLAYQGLIVNRIEAKDDTTVAIFLEITDESSLKTIAQGQCKYVQFEFSQEKVAAKELQPGDNVVIYFSVHNMDSEIVDDTYVIKSSVDISKR